MQCKVGAAQPPDIQGDVSRAITIVISFMSLADQQGIDFLCFPECFLQGYTLETAVTEKRALSLDSKTFNNILTELKPYRVTAILGLIEKEGADFFNTVVVIREGKLMALIKL